MRGPGEKQLEDDRRLVEKRIHDLQRRAARRSRRRKERQVAARSDRLTVSLVGYTNAGKSTLMNALTGAGVLAEDKLFATLDTRTRRWQLAELGAGAAERHGRLHPRPAAPLDRQLQGHARRSPPGRPAAARGRRVESRRPRADQRRLSRCSKSWASRRRTRCWCSTRSIALADRGEPRSGAAALSERDSDQRPHARGLRPAARRRQRRPEPLVCRSRCRNRRRQRPAAGLSGRPRRGPRPALPTATA